MITIIYQNVKFLDLIPNDPERLSYWFVQNYLLKPLERIRILSAKSTLERLKLEVNYLRLVRFSADYGFESIV